MVDEYDNGSVNLKDEETPPINGYFWVALVTTGSRNGLMDLRDTPTDIVIVLLRPNSCILFDASYCILDMHIFQISVCLPFSEHQLGG